jgi:di/tricarboxylate transporter
MSPRWRLLMSLDMDAARKAKRAVSLTLMPLSFATILGGMITLIGTPPNIVIAQYREDALGRGLLHVRFRARRPASRSSASPSWR